MNAHSSSVERESSLSRERVTALIAEGNYSKGEIDDFVRYLSDERTGEETVQRLNRATGERLDTASWMEILTQAIERRVDQAA